MARLALLAPLYLQMPGQTVSTKTKNDIKKFMSQHNNTQFVCKSLENLLFKINSATKYEELPDKVVVSYKNIIDRNLNFKDTLDVVDLTIKISANRFNEKPKEVMFTGFATAGVVDINSYEKLNASGWLGGIVPPLKYGIEAVAEDDYCHKKDPTYWNPIILPERHGKKIIITSKSVPLEIILTFRQEQILQLILKGMTNYQISRRLTISEATVKMHIGIVFKKYGVKNRTQLIFSFKEKIG